MKKILCSALLAVGGLVSVSAFAAPPHHPHHQVCKRVMVHHHWVRHCR
ncbi:hypothetical protein [Robbsia sp. KACC 23696]